RVHCAWPDGRRRLGAWGFPAAGRSRRLAVHRGGDERRRWAAGRWLVRGNDRGGHAGPFPAACGPRIFTGSTTAESYVWQRSGSMRCHFVLGCPLPITPCRYMPQVGGSLRRISCDRGESRNTGRSQEARTSNDRQVWSGFRWWSGVGYSGSSSAGASQRSCSFWRAVRAVLPEDLQLHVVSPERPIGGG